MQVREEQPLPITNTEVYELLEKRQKQRQPHKEGPSLEQLEWVEEAVSSSSIAGRNIVLSCQTTPTCRLRVFCRQNSTWATSAVTGSPENRWHGLCKP